jgi:hypothetical protein
MSNFVTQEDLDQKVMLLREMDNTSLVSYVSDLCWHFRESQRQMTDDIDTIHEEYIMARMELERRLEMRL